MALHSDAPAYIWQSNAWKQGKHPAFTWQSEALSGQLARLHRQQGQLLGQSESLADEQHAAQLDALVQSALRTSEIEGEMLNAASVRSSVVKHLGLEQAGFVPYGASGTPQTDALVKLLIEATTRYQDTLTPEKLCQWQAALFPSPPIFDHIHIGELRGEAPMQVISGRLDNPTVHFEAPPRAGLERELERFCAWFNQPSANIDPLLRAGIAHLWLITLHPFDDGNGRVTRAVTDRALAQAEHTSIRYYSLSAAIMAHRKEYYEALEQTQKGSLEITAWLKWFLDVLEDSMQQGQQRFQRVLGKARFWRTHAQTILNERQIKVLNRLLDTLGEQFNEGVNARQYMSLAKVSKATATRELTDLLEKKCLRRLPGGGRSTRYALEIGS